MTEKNFEVGGSKERALEDLREVIALFDNFPTEGVPVTTDKSGNWPPVYDNLQNYDRVATNVMRALHYIDSIAPELLSPELIGRVKQIGKDFYVSQDPVNPKTPRMVYTGEDISRLRELLVDIGTCLSP